MNKEKTSRSDVEVFPFGFTEFDDADQRILSPLSRIRELESKWVIEFDLPLVNKENISITYDPENTITVEAKLREPYCDPNLERCKFEYFKKTTSLPGKINEKNISASFSNGRLTITIPKISSGTKISVE